MGVVCPLGGGIFGFPSGAGRPAGGCRGSPAAFAPCPVGQGARRAGGGALPVKGDSFRIKRIPLDNPEEKFWGRFDSAPRPLLRPKGGLGPPLETPAGGRGTRGAARRVVVPYGSTTGGAQQRADVGIGPYGSTVGSAQRRAAESSAPTKGEGRRTRGRGMGAGWLGARRGTGTLGRETGDGGTLWGGMGDGGKILYPVCHLLLGLAVVCWGNTRTMLCRPSLRRSATE